MENGIEKSNLLDSKLHEIVLLEINNLCDLKKYCKNAFWNCEKSPEIFELLDHTTSWNEIVKDNQVIYFFASIYKNIIEIDGWKIGNKINKTKLVYNFQEIEYEYALLLEDLNNEITYFHKFLNDNDLKLEKWQNFDIKQYENLNIKNIHHFLNLTNFMINTFKKYLAKDENFWTEAIILLAKYAGNFETFLHTII